MTVEGGKVVVDEAVATNVAGTCPDMFAWLQLVEATNDEWWNWGLDQTVWPTKPLPICTDGETIDWLSSVSRFSYNPIRAACGSWR